MLRNFIFWILAAGATFQSAVITISAQSNAQCSWGLFKCEGESKCIPSTRLCDSISDCFLGDDEKKINCLNSTAPPMWIDNVTQTSPYATRAYIDDHVVVYFDRNVNRTTTIWLFPVMSYAWAYVKDLYGDFGSNPLLYVILREEVSSSGPSCFNRAYTETGHDKNSESRNIINCNDLEDNPDGSTSTQARNSWSMANSLNLEKLLTNVEDIVGKGTFLSTTPQLRQTKIFQNYIRDLFLHDLYRFLRKEFPELSEFQFNTKTALTHFQIWTQHLYDKHGETSALKNIFGAIKWYGPREIKDGLHHFNNGLILHFGIELMGSDFEPLYISFFGNTTEHRWQFRNARRAFPFTDFIVPYADQQIEVYLRPYQFYPRSTYKTASEAWKYFKNQYGPFLTTAAGDSSNNHEIYFNRRNNFDLKGCNISHVIENNYYNQTTANNEELQSDILKIIDCRAFGKSKNLDKEEFLEMIIIEMGLLALQFNNSWPGYHVSKLTINSILVYDAYLQTSNVAKSNKSAVNWELKQNAETSSFPRVETFWFRDWYQKIYLEYGKSALLKRFLAEVRQYSTSNNGTTQLNMGEFVHLWSGAAGANLEHVARAAFGWNETNHVQFREARMSLPGLNYPMRPLRVAFEDNHVQFYFKNAPNFPASTFNKPISDAWKYFKETYSPFGNESKLQILLYNESLTPADEPCLSPSSRSSTAEGNTADVSNNEPGTLNIIDCSPYDSPKFDTDTNWFLDLTLLNMVESTLRKWPGRELSGETMSSILVYDIYSTVDLIFHRERWSEGKSLETQSFPRDGTFWFQNWYFSIYQRHRTLPVLRNFFSFLHKNNVEHQVNMGEWVHFWSEAAQNDLRDVAEIAFGWNETYWSQLEDARKKFPKFTYTWKDRKVESIPGNSFGTILGISVSFLVCLLGFGTAFGLYQRKIRQKRRELTPEEVEAFLTGVKQNDGSGDAYDSVDAMRFNNRYELPMEKLAIDRYKVLGSGAFGIVLHGMIKGNPESNTRDLVVAVKTIQNNVETSTFMALLSEIKIMAHLGPHNHIVTLLGTFTSNIKNREVFAALEFCAHGDLLRYLQKHRETFQDLWNQRAKGVDSKVLFTKRQDNGDQEAPTTVIIDPTSLPPSPVASFTMSTRDLVRWSSQVASGMDFLTSKNVIHGDLATRNILLTSSNVAKISDFGLSRQLMNLAVYKKKSSTPIPWKWLALESLCENVFSIQSDIWSFGVTLWEIFTLGKVPYPGKFWDGNFVNNLVAGDRMEAPEFGNDAIYALMLDCWKKEPMDRIPFIKLHSKLEGILGGTPSHSSSLEDDEVIYASV